MFYHRKEVSLRREKFEQQRIEEAENHKKYNGCGHRVANITKNLNLNEMTQLKFRQMTKELRDEEIIQLRREAGKQRNPALIAAMDKVIKDNKIDGAKIRKYVEYPTHHDKMEKPK